MPLWDITLKLNMKLLELYLYYTMIRCNLGRLKLNLNLVTNDRSNDLAGVSIVIYNADVGHGVYGLFYSFFQGFLLKPSEDNEVIVG